MPSLIEKMKNRRVNRGQSLVEFAMVSVILFFMIFGVMEAGRFMFYFVQVSTAAQEGVRFGITHARNVIARGSDGGGTYAGAYRDNPCNIVYKARERLTLVEEQSGQRAGAMSITVKYDNGDYDSPVEVSEVRVGHRVVVRAVYNFRFIFEPFNSFVPASGYPMAIESARTVTALGTSSESDVSCDVVPYQAPTNTPAPTSTATPSWTPIPTDTPQPTSTGTATLPPTSTATATHTPPVRPTNTSVPLATNTPRTVPAGCGTGGRPTCTPVPVTAATNTAVPAATYTPVPTGTAQPSATSTPTFTPTGTATATETATATATPCPLVVQIISAEQAGNGRMYLKVYVTDSCTTLAVSGARLSTSPVSLRFSPGTLAGYYFSCGIKAPSGQTSVTVTAAKGSASGSATSGVSYASSTMCDPTPTPTFTPIPTSTPTWTSTPTRTSTPIWTATTTPAATATPCPLNVSFVYSEQEKTGSRVLTVVVYVKDSCTGLAVSGATVTGSADGTTFSMGSRAGSPGYYGISCVGWPVEVANVSVTAVRGTQSGSASSAILQKSSGQVNCP